MKNGRMPSESIVTLLQPASVFALAIVIAVVGFTAITTATQTAEKFATLKKQQLDNEARYQCAQSSRYETKQSEKVFVWYPVKDLYNDCLKEKGL